MAGIYLHIPFCRKACHYCNFHFSTSLHRKEELLHAMLQEIGSGQLPAGNIPERQIATIYFGGGTPSLLSTGELQQLLQAIHQQYQVLPHAEITLEANPDDITASQLEAWRGLGINRLSIGVQSFFEDDLRWMNRAHNAIQAEACIRLAREYGFDNLTIDLIYGTPTLTDERWRQNVDKALALGVTHLSCYALTVEEKTALHHFIQKGKIPAVEEERQSRQFLLLMAWIQQAGFEHYEISNFAKPGHRSQHNSNYWAGVPYYGFGPSAHSFNGQLARWWNVANNAVYIEKMAAGEPVFEIEELTPQQRLNERIMTSLRTIEGLEVNTTENTIAGQLVDNRIFKSWLATALRFEKTGWLYWQNNHLVLTTDGKLYADGIAADLFLG